MSNICCGWNNDPQLSRKVEIYDVTEANRCALFVTDELQLKAWG